MRLTDLEPRWIVGGTVFVFLCPHCQKFLLVCTNVPMSMKEQQALFEKEFGENWNTFVVPMRPGATWSISGTRPSNPGVAFPTDLTVSPSIDASASGCWHGFITNGEVIPPG